MHASTEQLLRIKDGDKSQYNEHIYNCKRCQKTLSEITQMQSELQSSSTRAPVDMWDKIQFQYQSKQNISRSSALVRAIYTLAATILLTGGLIVFSNHQQSQINIEQYQDITQLMASSNSLENSIAMQVNSLQTNGEPLYQNEKLKWRLMLIDQMIQSTQTDDLNNLIILWQDRIRALRALSQNIYTNTNTQQL